VRLRKIIQGLLLIILTGVLSVAALLTASAFKWANELPDLSSLDTYQFTATSQVFARDGTLLGEILPSLGEGQSTTNRIPVNLDQVSPAALQAIVAYEDDQFFKHYGFDLPGIAKAFYEEFFGDEGRGGSTISTQVIKNVILTDQASERTLERKAKEIMLAIELERRLTKPEILQRYVNVVFWGGNVYGIRAAAKAHFGKDPIDLTLAEGLYLARLIPAANARYKEDFKVTRASMKTVLDKMVAQNMISQETANRAWKEKIQPKGWKVEYDDAGNVLSAEATGEPLITQETLSKNFPQYAHVILAVRNEITDRYGQDLLFSKGGLKIYTTIDVQAQKAADEASLNAEVPPGAQTAIVGIDPATGEVLAMVGEKRSADRYPDEFNRVVQAFRQPGSSFKPITYATFIESGFTQASVLVDEPTTWKIPGQADYKPENHDKKYAGAVTVRRALDISLNIPAVKAIETATPEAVANRARELGYTSVQPTLSLSLGAYEVTPLQHAAAFAAFANGGVKIEAHFIKRIENASGSVIFEANPRKTTVWTPQTAYIMLDVLHGNVVDSNAFSLRADIKNRYVSGKTGTTNDEKDIWFVGMTPGMVAAVWIGYDDGTPIPKKIAPELTRAGDGTVGSSRQPIYIWKAFVEEALKNRDDLLTEFPIPDSIEFKNMDLISGGSGGTRAAFRAGEQLGGSAISSQMVIDVTIDITTGKLATAYTPRENLQIRPVKANEISQYINR
jgi:membrane peptidoglycan carboxypeptidase